MDNNFSYEDWVNGHASLRNNVQNVDSWRNAVPEVIYTPTHESLMEQRINMDRGYDYIAGQNAIAEQQLAWQQRIAQMEQGYAEEEDSLLEEQVVVEDPTIDEEDPNGAEVEDNITIPSEDENQIFGVASEDEFNDAEHFVSTIEVEENEECVVDEVADESEGESEECEEEEIDDECAEEDEIEEMEVMPLETPISVSISKVASKEETNEKKHVGRPKGSTSKTAKKSTKKVGRPKKDK